MGLAAPILGWLYYRLLVLLIGWTSPISRPSWWIEIFPSRHLAAVMWLISLHTIGVAFAATPIAIAVVAIARKRAVLIGIIVGVVATALAISPYFQRPDLWHLVWNSQPIFFVTDQIKLIIAVPLVAWIFLKVVSRGAFSMTALRR